MKHSTGLFWLCIVVALLGGRQVCRAADKAKPNIIVILVDDMGFSDISCFGSEIPTPNLDKLAANGLSFTQFYNTGRCCPTRASLLTGLYAHQAGVGHMVEDTGVPGYRGRLNDSCVTLAEVLVPAGYFTAMSGKWHVGYEAGVTPANRGFDRSLCAPAGGFYQPGSPRAQLYLNGKSIANDDPRLPKNWYTTDLWTDYGLKFIDEAREAKKPFFLYLAHNAPHFPLQAPAEDIAKFRGKYTVGWDAIRDARYDRQKQLGVIDPAWALSPRPATVSAWATLTSDAQDRFDHLMAVYAACVYHMDLSVGRLVDGLKERGELDNTLILFMSDNGGNAESGPQGRTEGNPTLAQSTWYCGESWANAENTPYRRYKHFNHEYAAHRALADGDRRQRRTARAAGPRDRPDADARGGGRRDIPSRVQIKSDPSDGGPQPGAGLREQADRAGRPVLGARGERRGARGRHEAGASGPQGGMGTVRSQERPHRTARSFR
jgi:arylsulfatase A-like enzyme